LRLTPVPSASLAPTNPGNSTQARKRKKRRIINGLGSESGRQPRPLAVNERKPTLKSSPRPQPGGQYSSPAVASSRPSPVGVGKRFVDISKPGIRTLSDHSCRERFSFIKPRRFEMYVCHELESLISYEITFRHASSDPKSLDDLGTGTRGQVNRFEIGGRSSGIANPTSTANATPTVSMIESS
jgi:hypothetical protein